MQEVMGSSPICGAAFSLSFFPLTPFLPLLLSSISCAWHGIAGASLHVYYTYDALHLSQYNRGITPVVVYCLICAGSGKDCTIFTQSEEGSFYHCALLPSHMVIVQDPEKTAPSSLEAKKVVLNIVLFCHSNSYMVM